MEWIHQIKHTSKLTSHLFSFNQEKWISFRHILIGPAFGLTNTAVPFPSLSNILFNIAGDPATEICDESILFWSKLKKHIYLINRTLNGFDGLLTKDI